MPEKMTTAYEPPKAKKSPHQFTIHGRTLRDEYFWLRDRNNAEVIAYLEAENAYTDQVMKDTGALEESLYKEMLARIKETDMSVPVKVDDYYYYSRTEQGKQYSIHCCKHKSLDSSEQILLDSNVLAQGHGYFRLGVFRVSPDHRLLAYSTDTSGSEEYTLFIKDLAAGRLLLDTIANTAPNLEWALDNKNFFYTTLDYAKRPYQLFRHELGQDPAEDAFVYHEKDEAYFLSVDRTKDRKFIVAHSESKTTSEARFLRTDDPSGKFQLVEPRTKDLEYSIEHHDGRFLILTNDQAKNFKLAETPLTSPGRKYWKDLIPHRPEVKIDSIDLFERHLVVYERERGLTRIRIRELEPPLSFPRKRESNDTGSPIKSFGDDKEKEHLIAFEEPAYTVHGAWNPEFHSNVVRFEYASLTTPSSVYDYDMRTRERKLLKQEEVLGGYDPKQYQSERTSARSHDGIEVPISLVYKKGIRRNGRNPLLLYGYGAYDLTSDPWFSSTRISLLDRGFVFALAHIRGGGDLGRRWYEDGKFLKKKNSFFDFIACAEHLIQQRFTSPEHLVIYGGSAGGLLMGAVMNMRPELFSAVIAKVPFVDVVNTMLDKTLPLTVIEYEEWGNPEQKEFFEYILSYSPYDNVKKARYPHVLVTAGLNDARVQYWEPAKWVAKLRELKTGDHLLLMKMNMGAGHSGPSGRYDYLKEIAFEDAFILKVLNIK